MAAVAHRRGLSPDSSSDDEGIQPIQSKQNKENRLPQSFSLTNESTMDDDVSSKAKKQQQGKSGKAATSRVPANAAVKVVKRSKSKSVAEADEEEVVAASEDEVMEDVAPVKKAAKKVVKAKKGKVYSDVEEVQEDTSETPKEKRLAKKLALTTDALKQVQMAFEQLKELRTTRAEESEKALTDIAAERQAASFNMIQNYKQENDTLRAEISDLRHSTASRGASTTVGSTSSSRPADAGRISRLEDDVERLNETNRSLQATLESLRADSAQGKEKAAVDERKKMVERDQRWEKEIAKTVKAKDEQAATDMASLRKQLATATQELEAEISHSKSMQAKNKTGTVTSSTSAVAGNVAQQKLQEEFDNMKARCELNEDLTGLSVLSHKQQDGSSVYNCVLQECNSNKTEALNFKLTFLTDGSACYEPDIVESRDEMLWKLLPHEMRSFMRFEAVLCSKWFRSLFHSINRLRD